MRTPRTIQSVSSPGIFSNLVSAQQTDYIAVRPWPGGGIRSTGLCPIASRDMGDPDAAEEAFSAGTGQPK